MKSNATIKKSSFTLLEILIVTTIIAILISGAIVSYSQFSKQARDSRRKTDLENIRASLEMYRSNVNIYPLSLNSLVPDYIISIPKDPKTAVSYAGGYTQLLSGNSYSLSWALEGGGTYTVGPYGSSP